LVISQARYGRGEKFGHGQIYHFTILYPMRYPARTTQKSTYHPTSRTFLTTAASNVTTPQSNGRQTVRTQFHQYPNRPNPNQKRRISRKELEPPHSNSPSPALHQLSQTPPQTAHRNLSAAPAPNPTAETTPDAEPDLLEFRLFATRPVAKIRIRSPDPLAASAGFVTRERRGDYYFQTLGAREQRQFAACALSGAEVLRRARAAWPGCAVGWRVVRGAAMGGGGSPRAGLEGAQAARERGGKAGKKARIGRRKRIAAERERGEVEERRAAEKAVAEREKRSRRNRERQVKRRAREKARRVGVGAVVDAGV
jgi:Fungal protein of unknown function (DUF2011)